LLFASLCGNPVSTFPRDASVGDAAVKRADIDGGRGIYTFGVEHHRYPLKGGDKGRLLPGCKCAEPRGKAILQEIRRVVQRLQGRPQT
jgi:hypothetical protein